MRLIKRTLALCLVLSLYLLLSLMTAGCGSSTGDSKAATDVTMGVPIDGVFDTPDGILYSFDAEGDNIYI